MCIQFEAISNIHYCYVALNAGIFERLGLYGAGVAQIVDNRSKKWPILGTLLKVPIIKYFVKYGVVLPITGFFIAPFQDYSGDEKEDNFAIKIGYEYYRNNDFCGIIRKQAANLKHGKTDCEPRHEVGTPPGIERIITW